MERVGSYENKIIKILTWAFIWKMQAAGDTLRTFASSNCVVR